MARRFASTIRRLSHRPSARTVLIAAVATIGLLQLVQFAYPSDRLLPLESIDGLAVGGQTREAAASQLDQSYRASTIGIHLSDDERAFASPTLAEAGISIDNQQRLETYVYPWYLRLVPTSLVWAQLLAGTEPPQPSFSDQTDEYIDDKLMPQCRLKPIDASLAADGDKLVVKPSVAGGKCTRQAVAAEVRQVRPDIAHQTTVRLPLVVVKPAASDAMARRLADKLNPRLSGGIEMTVAARTQIVPASVVASWVETRATASGLTIVLSSSKSESYLSKKIAPRVAVAPGISRIKTRDFTVISRKDGASGRALDRQATLDSVESVLLGESQRAAAVTMTVPPREVYTRTYSPTDAGLSALLANYASDHRGSYAAALIELGGQKRRAQYQGDKRFVTASTYKLFVAYSLLKRIDDGRESWSSNADCFNRMITNSDNACAERYLDKLGLGAITHDIQAIGLADSNFTEKGGPYTTANDLALLLGQLQSGQNFSSVNRTRLLSAMRANIFRQGIPAGTSAPVADKVGFLDGLLHDAAIVYSPRGTYVLVIMSDGSTWGDLAELTRQIESLRAS